jgi:predicted dehydrogenase
MHQTSFNRRSFLKALATAGLAAPFVSSGLLAASRRTILRHASFGCAGMAWSDITELTRAGNAELVAVAEVDLNRTTELKKKFPHTRIYQDWRELLDKEGRHLDSVNVSTPDHMHAPIGMTAIEMGKHVYGQKPLTHDLFEVRQLTLAARRKRVVTQMGIQIQSTSHYRMAKVLIQAGTIGKVKEVHTWCPKSWGDSSPLPDRQDPVPAGFDWDLWLGVCQERPFIGHGYYHPVNWRNRIDFGTGTLGDMGCHLFDPVFTSLALSAPASVRSSGPAPNPWNWATSARIEYTFPGTAFTSDRNINLTWYDGVEKPPKDILALMENDEPPQIGSIFVGTQGALVLPHINRPLLYPDQKFKNFIYPEVMGADHWEQFVQACLGHAQTTANFDYSGPLTEAVLLGTVAARFPNTTLGWDPAKLMFNTSEANQYIRRAYRDGWHVKGLS